MWHRRGYSLSMFLHEYQLFFVAMQGRRNNSPNNPFRSYWMANTMVKILSLYTLHLYTSVLVSTCNLYFPYRPCVITLSFRFTLVLLEGKRYVHCSLYMMVLRSILVDFSETAYDSLCKLKHDKNLYLSMMQV